MSVSSERGSLLFVSAQPVLFVSEPAGSSVRPRAMAWQGPPKRQKFAFAMGPGGGLDLSQSGPTCFTQSP